MSEQQIPLGDWLGRFQSALADPASADWQSLFASESYWRDFLGFSWNIITLEGSRAIADMAGQQVPAIGPVTIAPAPQIAPMSDEKQGWFTFQTSNARGRGHVVLEGGKAKTLLTAMDELVGHEELAGKARPAGIEHRCFKGRKFWPDERAEEARSLGYDQQPYVLIVGGGQNGLQLAARLKRLGVPAIVVDALEKPGDCWRVRYKSLYLHDAIYMDHFPYLPFPDHWPLYTHKDKMADWLEAYTKIMEINFWGSTKCTSASYDEASGQWHVSLLRDGREVTMAPTHLVLATGLSGAKNIPEIAGAASFAGAQFHSADHPGSTGMAGKKCVVIGSNNSAHDIAADLWEADADVTMVQRSPTIVVRADTMQSFSDHLPYADPAIPTDLADLMMATTPFKMRYGGETAMTQELRRIDADFYARLEKSGFQLSDGEDGTGFLMAYHRRAAGYYIDVGACDLVADGEIGLAHGDIAEITPDGLSMSDGSFLPADVIVYATGYRPMSEWMAALISPQVEARVGQCWGLGSDTVGDPGPWEGELRNMWKPTAQEGLWFQGGNLMQARFHSLHLALQLKARMEGVATPVYALPVG